MTDLIMPESLPGPEWDSLRWAPHGERILRSQMDGGDPRMRRRYTALREQLTCSLYLTAAQLQTLLDFHDITCADVLPFRWWDWRRPANAGPDGRIGVYQFLARPSHATWADIYRADLSLLLLRTEPGAFGLSLLDEDDEELTT